MVNPTIRPGSLDWSGQAYIVCSSGNLPTNPFLLHKCQQVFLTKYLTIEIKSPHLAWAHFSWAAQYYLCLLDPMTNNSSDVLAHELLWQVFISNMLKNKLRLCIFLLSSYGYVPICVTLVFDWYLIIFVSSNKINKDVDFNR